MPNGIYCIKHCGTTVTSMEPVFFQELQNERPRRKWQGAARTSFSHHVPKAFPKGC